MVNFAGLPIRAIETYFHVYYAKNFLHILIM
jgi:hypothetical protein